MPSQLRRLRRGELLAELAQQIAPSLLAHRCAVASLEERGLLGVDQPCARPGGPQLDGRQRGRDPPLARAHRICADDALPGHDVLVDRVVAEYEVAAAPKARVLDAA